VICQLEKKQLSLIRKLSKKQTLVFYCKIP